MIDLLNIEALTTASSIEADIPSRITGANRVFIRAVIARAILTASSQAYSRGLEDAARVADAYEAELTIHPMATSIEDGFAQDGQEYAAEQIALKIRALGSK